MTNPYVTFSLRNMDTHRSTAYCLQLKKEKVMKYKENLILLRDKFLVFDTNIQRFKSRTHARANSICIRINNSSVEPITLSSRHIRESDWKTRCTICIIIIRLAANRLFGLSPENIHPNCLSRQCFISKIKKLA